MSKTDKQLRDEIEADEAYFGGKRKGNRGRGAKNKTIVFGVLERNGKVHVDIVRNVKARTLLAGTIKKVRKGSVVYTDQWKSREPIARFLQTSGKGASCTRTNGRVTAPWCFTDTNTIQLTIARCLEVAVYINGIEGFWSFAKERMIKYHGIRSDKFLLYLKEMEWRYNHRDHDLFSLLVDYALVVNNL